MKYNRLTNLLFGQPLIYPQDTITFTSEYFINDLIPMGISISALTEFSFYSNVLNLFAFNGKNGNKRLLVLLGLRAMQNMEGTTVDR